MAFDNTSVDIIAAGTRVVNNSGSGSGFFFDDAVFYDLDLPITVGGTVNHLSFFARGAGGVDADVDEAYIVFLSVVAGVATVEMAVDYTQILRDHSFATNDERITLTGSDLNDVDTGVPVVVEKGWYVGFWRLGDGSNLQLHGRTLGAGTNSGLLVKTGIGSYASLKASGFSGAIQWSVSIYYTMTHTLIVDGEDNSYRVDVIDDPDIGILGGELSNIQLPSYRELNQWTMIEAVKVPLETSLTIEWWSENTNLFTATDFAQFRVVFNNTSAGGYNIEFSTRDGVGTTENHRTATTTSMRRTTNILSIESDGDGGAKINTEIDPKKTYETGATVLIDVGIPQYDGEHIVKAGGSPSPPDSVNSFFTITPAFTTTGTGTVLGVADHWDIMLNYDYDANEVRLHVSNLDWQAPVMTLVDSFPSKETPQPRMLVIFKDGVTTPLASIGQITVARDSILLMGSSFTSTRNNKATTIRSRMSQAFYDTHELIIYSAFKQKRYVINAGISGSGLDEVRGIDRWRSDLKDFKNVLVIVCNGYAINSLIQTSPSFEPTFYAYHFIALLAEIVSDSQASGNDIIIGQIIPALGFVETDDIEEIRLHINLLLRDLSAERQVPLALVDGYVAGYSDSDGLHPSYETPDPTFGGTGRGHEWLTDSLVTAYVTNLIATVGGTDGAGDARSRY